MNNSDFLKLFAQANRKCGYNDYADSLEEKATVYEADEVLKEILEEENGTSKKPAN